MADANLRRRFGLRFLAYALVGAAGTACHYAVLVAAVALGLLAPVPASVLGAVVGAVVNFVLNARFTFHGRIAWDTASRFFAAAALAAAANGVLMALLLARLAIDYRLAQVLVTVLLLGATFVVNTAWTFRARGAP
jgi:putative flippase GtrA